MAGKRSYWFTITLCALGVAACKSPEERAREALDTPAGCELQKLEKKGKTKFSFRETCKVKKERCGGTVYVRGEVDVERTCAPDASFCGEGKGDGDVCLKLVAHFRGKDPAKVAKYLGRACDNDVASACFDYALGIEQDGYRGNLVEMYDRACNLRHKAACKNGGVVTRFGRGAPKDMKKAHSFEKRGCKLECGQCCNNLAVSHARGDDGMEKNEQLAFDLFGEACNAGHWTGCAGRASYLVDKDSIADDPAEAEKTLRKGCSHDDGLSCRNLGRYLRDGKLPGGKKIEEGLDMLEKGCKAGDGPACNSVGFMADRGQGGAKNPERAREFFDKGCKAKDISPLACMNLGRMHFTGRGGTVDKDAARTFFQKACKNGIASGCTEAKKLGG